MKNFKSLKTICEELGMLGGWLRATNLEIIDSENLDSATNLINELQNDKNVQKLNVLLLDDDNEQKNFPLISEGTVVCKIPDKHKLLGYRVITLEDINDKEGRNTNLTFVFTEPLIFR